MYRVNRALVNTERRGLVPEPIIAIAGETNRAGGEMGYAIATGEVAGRTIIVAGGVESSGTSVDLGAVYVATPEPR